MTSYLLQFVVSNLLLALPIALAAWWVQAKRNIPPLAHLLWLLVLVKLVTPPFLSLPVASLPPVDPQLLVMAGAIPKPSATGPDWQLLAIGMWLSVSALIAVWSLIRIVRFNRLLEVTSSVAGDDLLRVAQESARRLGLKTAPALHLTSANISPMLWWVGGRIKVYIPASLSAQLPRAQLDLIVAHELGHVCRRDYLVRWLEWLVCVLQWWNPLAWWARRNLRINEELCCDSLVITALNPHAHNYANCLITAVEVLTRPVIRPPAMASEINGGGLMERRIKMIVSMKRLSSTPRWLRNSVVLGALALLPFGLSIAQNAGDLESVENWLESGVNAAFITQEQADIMLAALTETKPTLPISREKMAAMKKQLEELIVRIEVQVESGQLTPEQAQQQVTEAEARFEMGLGLPGPDR